MAVHRAARVGPLQRRGGVRGGAAVRARAGPEAGCGECHECHTVLAGSPRRRRRWSAPRSSRSASTRCATWSAARRWRRSGRRWQIMIVEDADRLTEQACNALLKAIEEPTARTVWMLCAPTVEDVLPDDPLAVPAGHADHADHRGGRGVPGAHATASPRRWRRTPPAPARATSAGPARWPATRSTRNRRREVVSIPRPADLARRLHDRGRQPGRGRPRRRPTQITGELDAREKADLDTAYGVVERGRRPREYAPALSALERGQKTRAKRRQLDVVDRGLMDLMSVYRDAIALATGAPGTLVNEEIRGDVEQVARTSTPELNLRRIGGDLRRARADAGVQRAGRPGAGVDDGGPQGARRARG